MKNKNRKYNDARFLNVALYYSRAPDTYLHPRSLIINGPTLLTFLCISTHTHTHARAHTYAYIIYLDSKSPSRLRLYFIHICILNYTACIRTSFPEPAKHATEGARVSFRISLFPIPFILSIYTREPRELSLIVKSAREKMRARGASVRVLS